MIGPAGLLLAAAVWARGAAASTDSEAALPRVIPRSHAPAAPPREPLLELEEEMLAAAEVLP
ncbi:MAG: hypothetical protein AAB576_10145, partial [Elusimicrobiota bacterium]